MLAPNTLLQDRYVVMRLLGQGGMGAVYQATDRKFNNAVALKETFYNDVQLRKAFSQEATLLNRLRHAALPVVTDFFAVGDRQFLVMQYIPGKDLEQMLHERKDNNHGSFPLNQVLTWGDQLLDAMEYLHSQDPPIIHRDIKPQNLKLTPRGEVILLDFGLAKGVTNKSRASQSIRGYTPNYSSLEQIRGTGTDGRSDIYSLGATLYHLLTGEMPADAMTRMASILTDHPDPLRRVREVNPEINDALAHVIEVAMSPHADRRYPTAETMRAALRAAAGNIILASQPIEGYYDEEDPFISTSRGQGVAVGGAMAAASNGSHIAVPYDPLIDRGAITNPDPDHFIIPIQSDDRAKPIAHNEIYVNGAGNTGEVINTAPVEELNPFRESAESISGNLSQKRGTGSTRQKQKTGFVSKVFITSILVIIPLLAVYIFGSIFYKDQLDAIKIKLASYVGLNTSPQVATSSILPIDMGTSSTPVASATQSSETRIEVMRYSIEVSEGGGKYLPVSDLKPNIPEGGNFRFRFNAKQEGYLYVLARVKGDQWETYLTNERSKETSTDTGNRSNRLQASKEMLFPADGAFKIPPKTIAKFVVIFSTTPLKSLAFLSIPPVHKLNVDELKKLEELKKQWIKGRELKIDEVLNTNFAVMIPPSNDKPLAFEVEINGKKQ